MTVNANTQIYDKTIDRAAMIRLYERRVNGKVSLIIDGHAVRVDKLIKDAKASDKGFVKLREAIDQDIQRTYTSAHITSKSSLIGLAKDQASFTTQVIDKTYGRIWNTERPPLKVSEDKVLRLPLYKNKVLEEGWKGIGLGEKKRIDAIIRKGIADGSSLDDIAKNVRTSGAINISRYQAKALVVTAVTSVTVQVDHEIYKANEKALVGWQYVAVLDSRTTELCAHRDGTIYPISDTSHLPPAHFNCRSTTIPVFKSWSDVANLESVGQVRRRNIQNLTPKQMAFYDGQTPLRESYHEWLMRQPTEVQLRHLGDYQKVELFRTGQVELKQFTNPEGNSVGIRELRAMTDSGYAVPGDSKKFAIAKEKMDSMQLWATNPDDFINDSKLARTLQDYYLLQAKEIDGTLSLMNYRGTLIGTKKATKNRVLMSPPREDQTKFNPITGRYEDVRVYQPNPSVLANNIRLVNESEKLLPKDKEFINKFVEDLSDRIGMNERAVIADNLRIIFGRYRDNGEIWGNFKAVVQGQIKFDVMNVSDAIETQIRKDSDILKKLLQDDFIDPVLGPVQLQEIHDKFFDNIIAKNTWDDRTAPKIARQLRSIFDYKIPPLIRARLSDDKLQQFYLKFAHRLSLADMPDRDNFAVALGKDLYNLANLNGRRNQWYELGLNLLESRNAKKMFTIETYGVQKRRMKSRMSGKYFGPYYDTTSYNIRIVDPRIQEYARLNRSIDLGLRVSVVDPNNRLLFREGYKTYWIKRPTGYYDTRIPITSTSSFSEFPEEFIDKNMADALNWAAQARYKIDKDYFKFINKLLYFVDDKGKADFYDGLSEYRKFMAARGDSYERLKAMEWLDQNDYSFSNQPFIDHRARIYDRGLIGPQAGETFRPFLNTEVEKPLGINGFKNLQDQVGSFLGGLDDRFEGNYNSLTFPGRQKIAEKWRPELIKIGNHMLRAKPNDIRAILESGMASMIDGEELGKFYRLAIEAAKIDNYLKSGTRSTTVTDSLIAERRDVAGLAKILGIDNTADPEYVGTLDEIVSAQKKIISMVKNGKIEKKELQKALGWLHTADIELTKERYERATYKTYDHKTGKALSKEEIKTNKAKFEKRSNGNTDQYIARQLVEELGELLQEHLTTLDLKTPSLSFKIEAQKRALKAARFGLDTVIKDVESPYYLKTNKEAAEIAAKQAGLSIVNNKTVDQIADELNNKIKIDIANLTSVPTNPYSQSNLKKLDNYMTGLALEQDASSSGAQIIALTTKNKQLANLSNVIPTEYKKRLYDEIAAATYNDPRFKKINERLNLGEKDLRKAAKAQNMVTFYGAGERTGALNVEGKLAKILEKDVDVLVVRATERDAVLNEISARMARYEKFDPETYQELKTLRENVKDIFNKGLDPGDEIMEQLYFLDPKTKDFVEKLTGDYDKIVTPNDFKEIASIMSDHLSEEVPIIKDFTKYFGRLAEDYLNNAKPSKSDFDWKTIFKIAIRGEEKKGFVLPDRISEILGIKAGEPLSEKFLKRFGFWKPDGTLDEIINGINKAEDRRTGAKYFKYSFTYPTIDVKKAALGKEKKLSEFEIFFANKLPKSWTNVPWVNFDGKIIEQNFTQVFEQRLTYKDEYGNWVTNILQVPQKSEATWWEQIVNKEGKINDIADTAKARTAFAVNGNHSNDATLVKNFHLWGMENNIPTSTIHDAFFTNIADMTPAKQALRKSYARVIKKNVVLATLNEMKARGLPKDLYDKYLKEAIETGLIPIEGVSKIGGKTVKASDILTEEDILKQVADDFNEEFGWYGIG